MFIFKKQVDTVYTEDFFYDLFQGGYIKPSDFLETLDSIVELQRAIDKIEHFREEAIKRGFLKET